MGVAELQAARMNAELAESSYLFFDKIFTQGLGVKDIFTSTRASSSRRWRPLYGTSRPRQRLRGARPGRQRGSATSRSCPSSSCTGTTPLRSASIEVCIINLDVSVRGPAAAEVVPALAGPGGRSNQPRARTMRTPTVAARAATTT